MEHVIEIMSIIDENKEKLRDGDYIKLCRSVNELYRIKTKHKKPNLSLNRKMNILLQYLHETTPEYIPILTRPYNQDNLRYTEYLCALTTDVNAIYRRDRENHQSSHYQLL